MIKQGNVRRALSRPALVVICGAAGLLLPLAPSFGDDAAPANPTAPSVAPVAAGPSEIVVVKPGVVANVAPSAPVAVEVAVAGDDDNNNVDVQAKADKDRAQAEKQRADAERRAADAQKRMAERYEQELQRAHRDLERAQSQLQRAAQRVAELEAQRGEMMSRFAKAKRDMAAGGSAAAPQANPAVGESADRIRNFGRTDSARGGSSSGDVERRLDMMERQMQQMMDQLRQMRRQMRSGDDSGDNRPDAPSAK